MKIKYVLVTLLAVVSVLAFSGKAEAASQTFAVKCSGADAASAGSLALVGGSINADVTVTHDAAPTAAPGDTVAPSFSVGTSIAPSLIDTAISLLGISSVSVSDVSFAVTGSGAGMNQQASFGPFSETLPVSTGSGLSFSRGPVQAGSATAGVGVISYRLTPITMKVAIGAINVNVTCSPTGSNVVAKTIVRDPDAPVVSNTSIQTAPGGSVSIDPTELVTPGATPVIGNSYKVVDGLGSVSGSKLTVPAPDSPGTYTTTFEVCAEPKPESGTPGVNETVQLSFSKIEQNERPVAFSLKVGDVETPLIWTVKKSGWLPLPASAGSQSKTNMNDWGEYLFTSSFKAPTASDVQNALTAAGFETVVTGTFGNFSIEFVGKDAARNVEDVTVGRWLTVLPYEFFTQISALVSNLSSGQSSTPPPALLTDDQIVALIFAGKVDAAGNAIRDRILSGLTDAAPQLLDLLVNSFSQPPVIDSVNGEAPEPAQPLCAQGQVDVVVVSDVDTTPTTRNPGPAAAAAPGLVVPGKSGVSGISLTG